MPGVNAPAVFLWAWPSARAQEGQLKAPSQRCAAAALSFSCCALV